ncbi:sigma factor-like helix-turn-helix DNA-binding protein [Clostridioides difficile]
MPSKKMICVWCGKGFYIDTKSKQECCSLKCKEKFKRKKRELLKIENEKSSFGKTKKILEDLSKDFRRKKALEDETELLKKNSYIGNINFNQLGIKSNFGNKTIDDLIAKDEEQILINECAILHIDKKIQEIEVFLKRLSQSEYDILELRYFTNKRDEITFNKIAELTNFSTTTVKRKYNSAIKKIAFYKFGE